jgi:MFS family permease
MIVLPTPREFGRSGRSRAVLPVLALVTLVGTGSAMLTTLVSLALSGPGTEPAMVQAVLTAYPLGFLAGCLVTRPLVDRLGHERTFTLITVLAASAAFGFALTDLKPAWIGFRLLGGVAMSSMFVVCESWMNLYARQHDRGRLFSLYMLATAAAVLFGQLLLGLVGPASPHALAVGACTLLLAVGGKLASGPWPALPGPAADSPARAAPGERFGIAHLFRLAPVTVVSIFQSGITNLNLFVLTPLYAAKLGLSAGTAVALVTTISIAGMLAQTPAGWLSDRLDRRIILLAQGLLSVTLCAAIAWLGDRSVPLLFVLFFAYGAVALTVYPVAIAFANAQLPSRHMVAASGSLLLLYSIGNILTPGLAAGLMDRTAPQAMLFVLGSGGILVALAAAPNLRRQPGQLDRPADRQPSGKEA